jgi:hypothetical protein
MRFNAILSEAWVFAKFVAEIRMHFMQVNGQRFALGVGHYPAVVKFANGVRRVHPVQRFVCTTVGMNRDAAVSFHEQ